MWTVIDNDVFIWSIFIELGLQTFKKWITFQLSNLILLCLKTVINIKLSAQEQLLMGSNLANLSWNLTQRPTLELNDISRRELNKDGFLWKSKKLISNWNIAWSNFTVWSSVGHVGSFHYKLCKFLHKACN